MIEKFSQTLPPGESSTAGTAPPPATPVRERSGVVWLFLSFIVLATVAAYFQILSNFFHGDDFVHLTWLTDAIRNPELVWRNFHSSWLDGTTTRFYRPLISCFMVGDYLLWRTNGLGFHLTNLACHIASTVFLFLILSEVGKRVEMAGAPEQSKACRGGSSSRPSDTQTCRGVAVHRKLLPGLSEKWPLAAAALFALYPLHPEAVSWITGRVDAIVTVFTLASFWYYLQWRRKGELIWFSATAVSMSLALLSKEMAVTLPALFFIWEVFLAAPSGSKMSSSPLARFTNRAMHAIAATSFFWILLAGYFIVRRIALGTFVGGYDDSLFFVSNWPLFLGGWVHGMRMMLVPINRELLGVHHPLTKIWEVTLICSIVLTGLSVVKRRNLLAPFAFLLSWLALSLVPVYKIFAIADDLEGSRLAYLATAPLCALITFGFANWAVGTFGRRMNIFAWATTAILIACAGCLLWTNNLAWFRAGQESNLIRKELNSLYRSLRDDPQVLFIGLPDNVHGAYVCRNALFGMTKYPQMSRTVSNCLMMGEFEPVLPFGYLKDSMLSMSDKIKIFRWDGQDKKFIPVTIATSRKTAESAESAEIWSGNDLKTILSPDPAGTAHYIWLKDGSLEALGASGLKGRPKIHLSLNGRPCWSTDVLVVKVSNMAAGESAGAQRRSTGADLLYCNDLHPVAELRRRVNTPLVAGESTLYFPLRGLPEWALGGNCRDLQLLLPDRSHVVIRSVELAPPDTVMPQVSFPNSGYFGSKGFLHLSIGTSSQTVNVDGKKVAGAVRIELEVTRPNLSFETQNSSEPSRVIMKRLAIGTTSGAIILRRSDFPSSGIYEARPRALDSHGSQSGVAGDHIVVSVD